jgi:hypothetical protein
MSNPPRATTGLVRALCGKSTGDSGNREPVVVTPAIGVATACGNQRNRTRRNVWCSPRQELAGGVAEGDRRRRRAARTVGVRG